MLSGLDFEQLWEIQTLNISSISAWYRGVPGFKSRQGQEFFSESHNTLPATALPPFYLLEVLVEEITYNLGSYLGSSTHCLKKAGQPVIS